jgi:hypothetical protein
MRNKPFNSKYAIDSSNPFPENQVAELFGHSDEDTNPGYEIFDPSDNPRSRPDDSIPFDEQQRRTVDEYDSQAFSPVETSALKPPTRQLHKTLQKVVPFKSQWKADYLPVPTEEGEGRAFVKEDYQHDPAKWLAKVKKKVGEMRAMRLTRPDAFAAKQDQTRRRMQVTQDRETTAATLGLISETLRRSDAFGCKNCKGNGCVKCNGVGYDDTAAAAHICDIKQNAAVGNYGRDFHNQVCEGGDCSEQCPEKAYVDSTIRMPHREESNVPLKTSDVKAKPGRYTDFDQHMSYTVVDDAFEPTARLFKALGSVRAGEAPKKYTLCHVMNHDTVSPDANIDGTLKPDSYSGDEGIYHAGNLGRDKQSFFLVSNVNDNGTYDGFYVGRRLDTIRESRRELRKGRRGKVVVNNDDPMQGLNAARMDRSSGAVRTQVANLFNRIRPFYGERSPVMDTVGSVSRNNQYITHVKGVPAAHLAPVDDVGAALICDSGKFPMTRKKREIKGWFKGRGPGVRGGGRDFTEEQLDQPMSVMVHSRIGTGFSPRQFSRLLEQSGGTNGENTVNQALRFNDDLKRDAGLLPENFDSPESFEAANKEFNPLYEFEKSIGPTSDRIGPLTPVKRDTGVEPDDYSQPISTKEPKAIQSEKKTFNSGGTSGEEDLPDLDTSKFVIPMLDTPPSVSQAIKPPSIPKAETATPEISSQEAIQNAANELGFDY